MDVRIIVSEVKVEAARLASGVMIGSRPLARYTELQFVTELLSSVTTWRLSDPASLSSRRIRPGIMMSWEAKG